jgi:tryptophan 2,3-dioxygenase
MTLIEPLPPLDPAMDASSNHYWTYHSLATLLGCKRPLTASQDEDLFIAVHQICELAFHQMILDLERTLDALRLLADEGGDTHADESVYFLDRVNAMWVVVNTTMPILAGMRAFAEFRTSIGPTSGFQSFQFRRIEIMSGVSTRYWDGGTADASGTKHIAETKFDETFGSEVDEWFARYAAHNLRHYAARVDITPALTQALAVYEAGQLAFHKAHLGLAVTQLRKVGVEIGTGGTLFRDYLAKYEKQISPLFAGLAKAKS